MTGVYVNLSRWKKSSSWTKMWRQIWWPPSFHSLYVRLPTHRTSEFWARWSELWDSQGLGEQGLEITWELRLQDSDLPQIIPYFQDSRLRMSLPIHPTLATFPLVSQLVSHSREPRCVLDLSWSDIKGWDEGDILTVIQKILPDHLSFYDQAWSLLAQSPQFQKELQRLGWRPYDRFHWALPEKSSLHQSLHLQLGEWWGWGHGAVSRRVQNGQVLEGHWYRGEIQWKELTPEQVEMDQKMASILTTPL